MSGTGYSVPNASGWFDFSNVIQHGGQAVVPFFHFTTEQLIIIAALFGPVMARLKHRFDIKGIADGQRPGSGTLQVGQHNIIDAKNNNRHQRINTIPAPGQGEG